MLEIVGPVFIIILFIIGISVFLHFVPLGLWISAIAAGVRVGIDFSWYEASACTS